MPDQLDQAIPKPAGPTVKPRDGAGRFLPTHAGWSLEQAYQRGRLPRWARRLQNRRRFEFSVALGYPSWPSTPAPLRAAIDNALRAQLLAEHYFKGFWTDQDVPKRYEAASELLRRQLRDLGLPASQPTPDAAAILAGLRDREAGR